MKLQDQLKWFNENTQHKATLVKTSQVAYVIYESFWKEDEQRYIFSTNMLRKDFSTMVFRMITKVHPFDNPATPKNWLNA